MKKESKLSRIFSLGILSVILMCSTVLTGCSVGKGTQENVSVKNQDNSISEKEADKSQKENEVTVENQMNDDKEKINEEEQTNDDEKSHSDDQANMKEDAVVSKTPVYEGRYADSRSWLDQYYLMEEATNFVIIEISNVQPTSFEFEILEYSSKDPENKTVIVEKNTAYYTGDGSKAVCKSGEHNIEFIMGKDWITPLGVVKITASGMEELEGLEFLNHAIPGYEFS